MQGLEHATVIATPCRILLLLCCRCAALALQSIDRRVLYGQEVRVNWASQRDTRPDTSNHFHIFVGDLAAEVRTPPLPTCNIRCYISVLTATFVLSSVCADAAHVASTTSWFACLQVDDQMLLSAVQPLGGCSDARVVWDLTTGRSARCGDSLTCRSCPACLLACLLLGRQPSSTAKHRD
jgi:hypothetical protein